VTDRQKPVSDYRARGHFIYYKSNIIPATTETT
jgi:hypothetical protein